jgi:hypothetical protein
VKSSKEVENLMVKVKYLKQCKGFGNIIYTCISEESRLGYYLWND